MWCIYLSRDQPLALLLVVRREENPVTLLEDGLEGVMLVPGSGFLASMYLDLAIVRKLLALTVSLAFLLVLVPCPPCNLSAVVLVCRVPE